MSDFLFTSESVSEGHPDKVADQISDAVLDAILKQDKTSRVAAETLVKDNLVVLAGEITTHARVNYDEVARATIRRIGYNDPTIGFDAATCTVLVAYGQQSPDIAQGVDEGKGLDLEQGAGDQGLMFGYACDETPSLMPLPIYLSHRLVERQAELRRNGRLSWLRPDAKSQVTIRYVNGKPDSIDTVVLSTQHAKGVDYTKLKESVIEEVIKPVLPKSMVKGKLNYLVNPSFLAAVIPLLLIAMAIYFLAAPKMSDEDRHSRVGPAGLFAVVLVIGFYDGFFGPGTGSFLTTALVALFGLGMISAIAHTKLLNFCSNLAGLVMLVIGGHVLWITGLCMAAASIAGNQLGAHAAMRFGGRAVRPLLVLMCLGLTVKLLLDPTNPLWAWF